MQGCLNELLDPQPDELVLYDDDERQQPQPHQQQRNKNMNNRGKTTASKYNKDKDNTNYTYAYNNNYNYSTNNIPNNNNHDDTGFLDELCNPQPDLDVVTTTSTFDKELQAAATTTTARATATASFVTPPTKNTVIDFDVDDVDTPNTAASSTIDEATATATAIGASATYCLNDLAACDSARSLSRVLFPDGDDDGDVEKQQQHHANMTRSITMKNQHQVEAIYSSNVDNDSNTKNNRMMGRTTLWKCREEDSGSGGVAYLSECMGSTVMGSEEDEENGNDNGETTKKKKKIKKSKRNSTREQKTKTKSNKTNQTTFTYVDEVTQRRKRKCMIIVALLLVMMITVASILMWQIIKSNNNNNSSSSSSNASTTTTTTGENKEDNTDTTTTTTTNTTTSPPVPTTLPPQTTQSTTTTTTTDDDDDDKIVFYAISNTPYTPEQGEALVLQMQNLPDDAEFVVHLGNLHHRVVGSSGSDGAAADNVCEEWEYQFASDVLRQSPKPVFVLMGDQDSPDCVNAEEAYEYWKNTFVGFANHWQNVPMRTFRPSSRPENFSFEYAGVLFVGLHLHGENVGNDNDNNEDWETKVQYNIWFMQQAMNSYLQQQQQEQEGNGAQRIVILSHADPADNHDVYFGALTQFMDENWSRNIVAVPILFLNGGGDGDWEYSYPFLERDDFVRISVTGGSQEAPLRVQVNLNDAITDPQEVYTYERFSYSW